MQELYVQKLRLQGAFLTPIVHEDAISSAVYMVERKGQRSLILKIYPEERHFLRERYFLLALKERFPVPALIECVEPGEVKGAILMEHVQGVPLRGITWTEDEAFQAGALLARLHSLRAERYGDLAQEGELPRCPLLELKADFEESVSECGDLVAAEWVVLSRRYVEEHMPSADLLTGPCFVHRDFKPGNLLAERGEIRAVIDWEGARGSFAEEDFVRLDQLVWSQDKRSKEPFFAGIAASFPCPTLKSSCPCCVS